MTVSVTQQDINNSIVNDDYNTSLAVAVKRTFLGVTDAIFSPVGTTMTILGGNLDGVYNLDVISVSFCNLERLGIKVTIPYTATLTYA